MAGNSPNTRYKRYSAYWDKEFGYVLMCFDNLPGDRTISQKFRQFGDDITGLVISIKDIDPTVINKNNRLKEFPLDFIIYENESSIKRLPKTAPKKIQKY